MKKVNAHPVLATCPYCKKGYERDKGAGLGCVACWERRWHGYRLEDARLYYQSPLAGFND